MAFIIVFVSAAAPQSVQIRFGVCTEFAQLRGSFSFTLLLRSSRSTGSSLSPSRSSSRTRIALERTALRRSSLSAPLPTRAIASDARRRISTSLSYQLCPLFDNNKSNNNIVNSNKSLCVLHSKELFWSQHNRRPLHTYVVLAAVA